MVRSIGLMNDTHCCATDRHNGITLSWRSPLGEASAEACIALCARVSRCAFASWRTGACFLCTACVPTNERHTLSWATNVTRRKEVVRNLKSSRLHGGNATLALVIAQTELEYEKGATSARAAGLLPTWVKGEFPSAPNSTCPGGRPFPGAIGCLNAHRVAWQRIVEDGRAALILEDDARFVSTHERLYSDLARCNARPQCEILYAGYADAFFASHAVYVKPRGARRLLNLSYAQGEPCKRQSVDVYLHKLCVAKPAWYQPRYMGMSAPPGTPWFQHQQLSSRCAEPILAPLETEIRPAGLFGVGHFLQDQRARKSYIGYTRSVVKHQQPRCSQVADSDARVPSKLGKVFVTISWNGRLGNLLFEAAGLMGISARLKSIMPTTAFAYNLPSKVAVPARELFARFPGLTDYVLVRNRSNDAAALVMDLAQSRGCRPCTFSLKEESPNAFDRRSLRDLEQWAAHPPEGCIVGLVELSGYFQSFRYFDAISNSVIHPALIVPAATQREADALLVSARSATAAKILIGVQVRLGDKLRFPSYAQVDWKYYQAAMELLAKHISERSGSTAVGFMVTAGGSLQGNSVDVKAARAQLSQTTGQTFFSTASDPYVDLAILRSCDALIIGSSTLGWWAAYLSRLPKGRIVAPCHIISPKLNESHTLRRGFDRAAYYPPEWWLLDNRGEGHLTRSCGESVP